MSLCVSDHFSLSVMAVAAMTGVAMSTGQVSKLMKSGQKCVCHLRYSPVCSTNGNTFNNACMANCRGETISCHSKCPCPEQPTTYSPPPPLPDYDYDNPRCNDDCNEAFEAPVCGANNVTYPNRCFADCEQVDVTCDSTCPCSPRRSQPNRSQMNIEESTCVCDTLFDAVCGTNGETYTNECYATCKKVDVQCYGRCPCQEN